MTLPSVNLSQSFSIDESQDEMAGTESKNLQLRAKVMYDYVAKAPEEISVLTNEVSAWVQNYGEYVNVLYLVV